MKNSIKSLWQGVENEAFEHANYTIQGNEKQANQARKRLLRRLNFIIRRYPKDPNALATKADYVRSNRLSFDCLKRALRKAVKANDISNIQLIADEILKLAEERTPSRTAQAALAFLPELAKIGRRFDGKQIPRRVHKVMASRCKTLRKPMHK